MPLDHAVVLPDGDDLARGITDLLAGAVQLMGTAEAAQLRSACRGLRRHGVQRAVVEFRASAGDREIGDTRLYGEGSVIDPGGWPEVPDHDTDTPGATTTLVGLLRRVVYQLMPSHSSAGGERLFGLATIDCAGQHVTLLSRGEPEPATWLDANLPRDQLPVQVRALHDRLLAVLPLSAPYGHLGSVPTPCVGFAITWSHQHETPADRRRFVLPRKRPAITWAARSPACPSPACPSPPCRPQPSRLRPWPLRRP